MNPHSKLIFVTIRMILTIVLRVCLGFWIMLRASVRDLSIIQSVCLETWALEVGLEPTFYFYIHGFGLGFETSF